MSLDALLSVEGFQRVTRSLRELRNEGHEVENNQGRRGTQSNTGEDHITEGPGEVRDTHNQRYGSGGQVNLIREVHAVLAPDTNTKHANHAVQDGSGTTQNTSGNGCNSCTEAREERQYNCEDCRHPVRRG